LRRSDNHASRDAREAGVKTPLTAYGLVVDPDYRGKGLQIQFTVEDDGVFTMPWSATVTYRRGLTILAEQVCVEDTHGIDGTNKRALPRADKPDF
jgi:hypothetical protein